MAETLWEHDREMGELMPQTIRLSERIGQKPDFSMGSLREKMKKTAYTTEHLRQEETEGRRILKARGLYAGYGKKEILRDFSLDLREKEFHGGAGSQWKRKDERC